MPAPLLEPMEFVKWRVNADDLALLRAIHGDGNVNAVVRALLSAYCTRVRERGLPRGIENET